jgi:hypothetical protein
MRAGIRFSRKKNFLYAYFSYVIMEFSCPGGDHRHEHLRGWTRLLLGG